MLEATNLAGRDVIGRNYPVILERLLLLMVVIIFILGYGEVSDWSGEGFVVLTTWCLFPFLLLFQQKCLAGLIQQLTEIRL